MTASKFAVGDRVRSVGSIMFYEHIEEGSVGTVINVDDPTNPDSNLRVSFDDYANGGNDDSVEPEDEGAYVYPSEVEAAVSSPPPQSAGEQTEGVVTFDLTDPVETALLAALVAHRNQ